MPALCCTKRFAGSQLSTEGENVPQLSTPLVEQSYKRCPLGVWLFLTKTQSSRHCILTPRGRTNCVSLLVRHPQQVRAIQRPPPAHSGAVHGNAEQHRLAHAMVDLNSFASVGPRIARAAPVAPPKLSRHQKCHAARSCARRRSQDPCLDASSYPLLPASPRRRGRHTSCHGESGESESETSPHATCRDPHRNA